MKMKLTQPILHASNYQCTNQMLFKPTRDILKWGYIWQAFSKYLTIIAQG